MLCNSFSKLGHRVFGDDNPRKETMVMVYKAFCVTSLGLLYESKAWIAYCCYLKTLEKDTEDVSHPNRRANTSVLTGTTTICISKQWLSSINSGGRAAVFERPTSAFHAKFSSRLTMVREPVALKQTHKQTL